MGALFFPFPHKSDHQFIPRTILTSPGASGSACLTPKAVENPNRLGGHDKQNPGSCRVVGRTTFLGDGVRGRPLGFSEEAFAKWEP